MKTLIKILCLSVLWFSCESSTEAEDIYGCTVDTACNFDSNANIFNDSCIYLEDKLLDGYCSCDDQVFDCMGVCNGNSMDINNDGTCDYCLESEIYSDFTGYLALDETGNELGGDTTDWNCCSTQEGIIIGENNNNDGLPTTTALNGAYPNPFNPTISISLSNAQANFVNLYVINQNGQVVDSILSQTIDAGNYVYNWVPTEDIEGGLYRVMLNIVDSNDIHCFGDICYCTDNQNCDEICK